MLKYRKDTSHSHLHKHLHRFIYLFLLCAALIFYLVYWIDRQIRPIFLQIIQYECRQFAFNTFSDVAAENTEQVPEYYRQLYTFQYDPEGKISAVTVDAYAVNRIQSVLSNEIAERLLQVNQTPLKIPIGTLTGIQSLIGRGPVIKMHISPESYVDTEVYNTIESAGINQTRLSLYVRFTMNLSVAMAGYGTTVEVTNDQYLGEVLVLGDIPNSYLSNSG